MLGAYNTQGQFGVSHKYLHRSLLWQCDEDISQVEMQTIDFPQHMVDAGSVPPSWSWMRVVGAIKYLPIEFNSVDWSDAIRSPFSEGQASERGQGHDVGRPGLDDTSHSSHQSHYDSDVEMSDYGGGSDNSSDTASDGTRTLGDRRLLSLGGLAHPITRWPLAAVTRASSSRNGRGAEGERETVVLDRPGDHLSSLQHNNPPAFSLSIPTVRSVPASRGMHTVDGPGPTNLLFVVLGTQRLEIRSAIPHDRQLLYGLIVGPKDGSRTHFERFGVGKLERQSVDFREGSETWVTIV